MKNTTIGIDSNDSLPRKECPKCGGTGDLAYFVPSPTNVAEDIEQKKTCDLCNGMRYIYDAGKEISAAPDANPLSRPENVGIVSQVTNGIVTPNLQVLLASVLGTIDASIPNKDQNRAVKHIVRKQFDSAYEDILRRAYPDCGFAFNSDYSLHPEPNRDKAFSSCLIK